MTDLKTMSASDLIRRLANLETQVRHPVGYAHNPEALEREWRAVSRELNSRPASEVLG